MRKAVVKIKEYVIKVNLGCRCHSKENEIEKNILTKHTEIGGVNIISLITETIFNMVFLGEGISKSTLLYELKDFIEGTEQGENDLLFDRQNCFEITRRIILHLLPSESIENFSRKRRDLNG